MSDNQCERCGEANPAEIHTCTPKQEPVAWMYEYGTDHGDAVNQIFWHKNLRLEKPTGLVRNVVPLYTAPPQLCCEEYENCTRPCTPRGRWLAHMEDFKYKETEFVLKCKPAWQGLTDKEVFDVENAVPDEVITDRDWCLHFARAIEAKLKAKNA